MRHAWNPDHIAVIDDPVCRLLTLSRSASGAGLFFSLGHSGVVLRIACALDEVFHFYFPDALDALRDICLPPAVGGVLPGGGPRKRTRPG